LSAIALGLASMALVKSPSVLIADDGHLMGVMDPEGRLVLSADRLDIEAETWLRRSGTDEAPPWPFEGPGAGGRLVCDSLGCIYKAFGKTVALVQQPMALSEDCGIADIVVSLAPVRVPCRPMEALIDRFDLWRNGAYAIWIHEDGALVIRSVRDLRGERPWVTRPELDK
jgi:competence protein ComEC